MFERFRKKKQYEEQVINPNVIAKHIMTNREEIISLGYSAKSTIQEFLKSLSRNELMDFEDSKQFDGTAAEDAAWEAHSDEEWSRTWPIGEYGYKERIPLIVRDTMKTFEIETLQKQMDGIQKKLDRITVLLSNAKFELCGEDALKL